MKDPGKEEGMHKQEYKRSWVRFQLLQRTFRLRHHSSGRKFLAWKAISSIQYKQLYLGIVMHCKAITKQNHATISSFRNISCQCSQESKAQRDSEVTFDSKSPTTVSVTTSQQDSAWLILLRQSNTYLPNSYKDITCYPYFHWKWLLSVPNNTVRLFLNEVCWNTAEKFSNQLNQSMKAYNISRWRKVFSC